MTTKGKRLGKLQRQLWDLQKEIVARDLQEAVAERAKTLPSDVRKFRPVTFAEWQSMPPEEQPGRLVDLFLSLRAEEFGLADGFQKESTKGTSRLSRYLDSPVAKVINLAASLAALGVLAYEGGWQALRLGGLGAGPQEDQGDDVAYIVE